MTTKYVTLDLEFTAYALRVHRVLFLLFFCRFRSAYICKLAFQTPADMVMPYEKKKKSSVKKIKCQIDIF